MTNLINLLNLFSFFFVFGFFCSSNLRHNIHFIPKKFQQFLILLFFFISSSALSIITGLQIVSTTWFYYVTLLVILGFIVLFFKNTSFIQNLYFLLLLMVVMNFFLVIVTNHGYYIYQQANQIILLSIALLFGNVLGLLLPSRFRLATTNTVVAILMIALAMHLFRVDDPEIINSIIPIKFRFVAFLLFFVFLYLINIILKGSTMSHSNLRKILNAVSKTFFILLAAFSIFITTISLSNSKYAQWKNLTKLSTNLNSSNYIWFKSLNRATVLAKKRNGLILVDLWAKWCKSCLLMNKQVFESSDFKSLVKQYNITLVKLDFTKSTDYSTSLSQEYDVMGLPTILILNHKKELVQAVVGYKNAKKSLTVFKNIFIDYKQK